MAKKPSNEKDQVETELEEVNGNVVESVKVESNIQSVPKDKGYSIVFDEKQNKWLAVELLYDYQNGTFGGLKVIEANTNKYIIVDRFNVLAGRNLF